LPQIGLSLQQRTITLVYRDYGYMFLTLSSSIIRCLTFLSVINEISATGLAPPNLRLAAAEAAWDAVVER
jgi:hypothetical protein